MYAEYGIPPCTHFPQVKCAAENLRETSCRTTNHVINRLRPATLLARDLLPFGQNACFDESSSMAINGVGGTVEPRRDDCRVGAVRAQLLVQGMDCSDDVIGLPRGSLSGFTQVAKLRGALIRIDVDVD